MALPDAEDETEAAMDRTPFRFSLDVPPEVFRRLTEEQERRRLAGRPFSKRAIILDALCRQLGEAS